MLLIMRLTRWYTAWARYKIAFWILYGKNLYRNKWNLVLYSILWCIRWKPQYYLEKVLHKWLYLAKRTDDSFTISLWFWKCEPCVQSFAQKHQQEECRRCQHDGRAGIVPYIHSYAHTIPDLSLCSHPMTSYVQSTSSHRFSSCWNSQYTLHPDTLTLTWPPQYCR